mmetsp:Transcript_1948/g.2789  ORF Transcript_1948/g.2789 Transcript_1948/m.2789 type:complete len:293 (-) Transcript_1948:361-1239(-)
MLNKLFNKLFKDKKTVYKRYETLHSIGIVIALASILIIANILNNVIQNYKLVFGSSLTMHSLGQFLTLKRPSQSFDFYYKYSYINSSILKMSSIPGFYNDSLSTPSSYLDFKLLHPTSSSFYPYYDLNLLHSSDHSPLFFRQNLLHSPSSFPCSNVSLGSSSFQFSCPFLNGSFVQSSSLPYLSCSCTSSSLSSPSFPSIGFFNVMSFDNRFFTWSLRLTHPYVLSSSPSLSSASLFSLSPLSIFSVFDLNDFKEAIYVVVVILSTYSTLKFYFFRFYLFILRKTKSKKLFF